MVITVVEEHVIDCLTRQKTGEGYSTDIEKKRLPFEICLLSKRSGKVRFCARLYFW